MPFDALPSQSTDTPESRFLERVMQRIAHPKNWGRFRMERRTWFTGTPRCCMYGAMIAEGNATGFSSFYKARAILAAAIDPLSTMRQPAHVVIINYNDSDFQHFLHWKQPRHRDVMAVFRKAIEAARHRSTICAPASSNRF